MTHRIRILTKSDIDQLCLSVDDVLDAARHGLIAQSDGQALAQPTVSFHPLPDKPNLHSVIRGSDTAAKLTLTKTVGTYAANPAIGLPANPGLAILSDAETGLPLTLIDAAPLTTIRTAAVAAIGALLAGRPDSKILGCIGSRGIALQAAVYIAGLFSLSEIRIHSRDLRSCQAAAETLRTSSRATVKICADWASCLLDADIMIDGASLGSHQTVFPSQVLVPGSTLVAYGAYASAAPETAEKFRQAGHGSLGRWRIWRIRAGHRKRFACREFLRCIDGRRSGRQSAAVGQVPSSASWSGNAGLPLVISR